VIEFRPLRTEDMPLVATWLEREHVRQWWRDPIEYELRQGIAGRYLIVVDGLPAGVIQTYLEDDDALAGVDLFIGEEDAIGRGLGPSVLTKFAQEVVFVRPETIAVVATVEEDNRRSWRAFEKAGFHHVRDVEEEGLPHRLMRLDRS
jgi:aminoglycoside 6'-N-acetyltransferase